MIQAGTVLGGYRVERVIGFGGMGIVYEATQLSFDRRVALKVLRTSLAEDDALETRLRSEGRLQASIEHPNVLDAYEVGDSEFGLFLSMRLVEGGDSLARELESGALDAQRALDLLAQAASALDAAHAAGLVHGDVKPQNILVDGGAAYLGDFGLTRAGGDSLTASRALLGTVAYVAPEIIAGEAPRAASDIYSFAATMFHCLTGDPVFPLGTDAAVMYAHVDSPPPAASERRTELPGGLDDIFDAALSKDPERRPASAAALVESVREALGPELVERLGPPPVGAKAKRIPATGDLKRPGSRRRAPGLRPGLLAGALLASLAAGAVLAAVLLDDDAPASEVPVPAVAEGAQPLGSSLPEPELSVGCGGVDADAGSTGCAIAQPELSGTGLVAPADGKIVGWAVRGASGEMALDVVRPRGADTVRVNTTQFESAGNEAPHYFPAEMSVEEGDLLAVRLAPGARIGARESEGATTESWVDPVGGFYGLPEKGAGLEDELALRADFVPNGRVPQPRQLLGAAAADAAPGTVREQHEVKIAEPPTVVEVALVETEGRVALDLFRGGSRTARMFIPELLPGGAPIDLAVATVPGEGYAGVAVFWVNPVSGRLIFHDFNAFPRELELVG